VLPHYVFADVAERRGSELARLERRLPDWPVPLIARIHRTWLADVDARLVLGETAMLIDSDGREVEVPAPLLDAQGRLLSSVGLGDVADAYLYLGPVHSLTMRGRDGEPPTSDAAHQRVQRGHNETIVGTGGPLAGLDLALPERIRRLVTDCRAVSRR
jgi:hypothetical protein